MAAIERFISRLAINRKNFDSQLFTRAPGFSSTPNITVTSPIGPSSSILTTEYTADGPSTIPSLSWTLPTTIPSSSVTSYILFFEDADAPIGAIVHGGYYSIPATKTSITNEDFEPVSKEPGKYDLKGGFKYAKNFRSVVYGGPKPLRGHGEHRYFYQVIAVGEAKGEEKKLSAYPKKAELLAYIEGRILGWGEWVGVAIRE